MSRSRSTELVPVVAQLPATPGFNLSADALKETREDFETNLKWRYRNAADGKGFVHNANYLCIGAGAVLLVGAPPLGIFLSCMSLLTLTLGTAMQKGIYAVGSEQFESSKEYMAIQFKNAQRDFYNGQKRLIIEAADQHLGKGGLLAAEDAAWLGNLDPAALETATDQLAITALQIRKMLAHERCVKFNSDGSKEIEKPMDFAAVQFNPAFPPHRSWLREKLMKDDSGLAEDLLPILQEAEFLNDAPGTKGWAKSFFNFMTPFGNAGRLNEFKQQELPKIKDIEVAAISPIADFAQALASYEERNAPLDLPAVRGWKQTARKALPPKGVI